MRSDRLLVATLILLGIIITGCGGEVPPPNSIAPAPASPTPAVVEQVTVEEWASKPASEWPQIVLTNRAAFKGHTSLEGASGFLIRTNSGRVLAVTARHLLGSAGGVEPFLYERDLPEKLESWTMFPRTMEDQAIELAALDMQSLFEFGRPDWLVLGTKDAGKLPAHPLRLRQEPVAVGDTVYLIGCAYVDSGCKQNVYTGKVTERVKGDRFRYDIDPPVDIRGFSGAPIVDKNGLAVGLMTVWFEPKMTGEKYLEAGGEDVATFYEFAQGTQ